MPTYQYACPSCDHRFEAVQRMADDPIRDCPQCGNGVRRVFSSVGVTFKGSGFYKTDSRSSSTRKSGERRSESSSSEPATASKSASSETSGSSSSASTSSSD